MYGMNAADLVYKIMLGSAVLFTGSTAGDVFVMVFAFVGSSTLFGLHYLYMPHYTTAVNIVGLSV